ncbi:SGNH/GDSL hydrolase family protein [Paenibacillus albicereus]|nr:SGNH/GDSL hydrolase family protein [Paenibacillus albicereus]
MEGRLRTMALEDAPLVRTHGRTGTSRSPLALFWTGSGIELVVTGAELWLEVEASLGRYEPWFSMLVNGAPVSRQMAQEGRRWVPVFRGMNPHTAKRVRFVKESQAMSSDPDCALLLHGLRTDGELLPVPERARRIEFVGDSITSGEGAIGARSEEDWIPMWFSARDNYAWLTAEALDADCRILSQSGWGVLSGWDNDPRSRMPAVYEQACGLLGGERNEALGARETHDFGSWQPDAVVVNLGTNDGGAFRSPEWICRETGDRFKQRLADDGSFHADDLGAFEAAAERFLGRVRACNPQAWIVWAYGMLGLEMMPSICRAVDAHAKRTGDRRVAVFQLPAMTARTQGARQHPGTEAHRQAAEALAEHLRGLLGMPRAER